MHKVEKLFILSGNDKIQINIYFPTTREPQEKQPVIIIAPGAGGINSPKYKNVYIDLALKFVESGFTCVTFAARGQMGSTGVYSFRREAEDIHSIVNYLKIEHNYSNIGLFGRSAGTIAFILYSVEHSDKIKSLALWGTPTHVYEKHYRDEVPRKQMFESLQQEGVKIMDELFLKDVINPDDIISQVKLPILIVWGTADIKYSSIEEQLELFSQIGSNICGLFFIKGATHLIDSSDSKFETYANIFISWFKMTLHMGS